MADEEMVKAMEVCKDKEMPCDDCPLVEISNIEEDADAFADEAVEKFNSF